MLNSKSLLGRQVVAVSFADRVDDDAVEIRDK